MNISLFLPRFRIEHHGGMRFIHIPLGFGVWKLVIMICLSQKF